MIIAAGVALGQEKPMSAEYPIIISAGDPKVDWSRVAALFNSVGWDDRAPEALQAAFASSSVVRFANRHDGQLVGVCRAITDGVWYALIVDLIVSPDFQRQGLGRRLLESVCEALVGVRQVHLFSTRGSETFYEKSAFDRQSLQAFTRINKPTSLAACSAT
jgi:GNAT superfamily N-acetyltransferase